MKKIQGMFLPEVFSNRNNGKLYSFPSGRKPQDLGVGEMAGKGEGRDRQAAGPPRDDFCLIKQVLLALGEKIVQSGLITLTNLPGVDPAFNGLHNFPGADHGQGVAQVKPPRIKSLQG
jgi:hypothetical protein